MRPRRYWIPIAIVSVLALGAWIVFRAQGRASNITAGSSSRAKPNITLAVARLGDFVDRIDAQGRIGPPAGSSAKIVFAQTGILKSVDVRVGERIGVGEAVAELDRSALAAAVAQAEGEALSASASYGGGTVSTAGVDGAASRLALANEKLDTLQRGGQAALSSRIAAEAAARQAAIKVASDRGAVERGGRLLAAGIIAQKDLDAALAQLANDEADQRAAEAKVAASGTDFKAGLKQARADVATARYDVSTARAQSGVLGGQSASARARLAAARIAYDNGTLTAPANGVVLAIMKHPGEAVDPTQPVMEIGQAPGNSVTLSVPADVARRISVGDAVSIRGRNSRPEQTRGRVTTVIPAVDPTTQLATIVVSGAPRSAVAGDAVTATIVVGHTHGVLVPSTAIVQDPQTGRTVVFVHDTRAHGEESPFSMRDVDVGQSNVTTTVVASGLKAGEAVAARGGYALLAPSGG